MELATTVAAEESGLAEIFLKSGRMPELITAFALNSKAILQASDHMRRQGKSKRKTKELGQSFDIWNIAP